MNPFSLVAIILRTEEIKGKGNIKKLTLIHNLAKVKET
jgi:hypothetical protein